MSLIVNSAKVSRRDFRHLATLSLWEAISLDKRELASLSIKLNKHLAVVRTAYDSQDRARLLHHGFSLTASKPLDGELVSNLPV